MFGVGSEGECVGRHGRFRDMTRHLCGGKYEDREWKIGKQMSVARFESLDGMPSRRDDGGWVQICWMRGRGGGEGGGESVISQDPSENERNS